MKEARHWKRFLAFVADVIIVDFIIVRPLSNLIDKDINSLSGLLNIVSIEKILIVTLLIGALGVLYWSILEYKLNQTIGAMLFGLRAKSLDNKKITFQRSLVRNLSKLSTGFLIVDTLKVFFSPKRQRFLEYWSRTVTVEE